MSRRSLSRQLWKFSQQKHKPAGLITSFSPQDPLLTEQEIRRLNRLRNKRLEKAFELFGFGWIPVLGGYGDDEEESYIIAPIKSMADDHFEHVFKALLVGDKLSWGRQESGFIKRCDTPDVILLGRNPDKEHGPYKRRERHYPPSREGYIGLGYTKLKSGPRGSPKPEVDIWGSTLPEDVGTRRDHRAFCMRAV